MTAKNHLFRKIAGLCMLLAPLVQFTADVVWVHGQMNLLGTVLRQLSYILFIPAIIGTAYLCHQRSIGWSIAGAFLCLLGIGGGISILTLYRLGEVFEVTAKGVPIIIEEAFSKSPLMAVSIFIPGIFFPLGHIISGIGWFGMGMKAGLLASLFILSGLSFWAGNALDIIPVLFACDMLMIVLYGWLSRNFLAGATLHYQSVEPSDLGVNETFP